MEFPQAVESIWAPWRVEYFGIDRSRDFLAEAAQTTDDAAHLVVSRRKNTFLIMNRFPYSVGHMMAVPYRKVADIADLTEQEQMELWELAAHAQRSVEESRERTGIQYRPQYRQMRRAGYADHLHLHIVPAGKATTISCPCLPGRASSAIHWQACMAN